jgi:hypothetical protein
VLPSHRIALDTNDCGVLFVFNAQTHIKNEGLGDELAAVQNDPKFKPKLGQTQAELEADS